MSKLTQPSLVAAVTSAALLSSNAAFAQENDGWGGEAAFSAGYTTGNTETTDLGLGIDVSREQGVWTYEFVADGEYGEQDGVESRNRYFLSGDVDRLLSDKLFAFGRTSYEVDQFTGFDSRSFVGGGLGYHIYDGEQVKWTVRGGPGVKIGETSTQIENMIALTASVSAAISARVSFNVRHDTNPADDFEDTDTALKVALVYGFGQ